MKYARILGAAVGIEVLAILILVVVVALFGPSDTAGAEAFAKDTGRWLGPLAGFVLTLGASWYLFKGLKDRQVLNGIALGAVVALIDVGLLFAAGSGFEMIFVISNVGKLAAGFVGGWLASR